MKEAEKVGFKHSFKINVMVKYVQPVFETRSHKLKGTPMKSEILSFLSPLDNEGSANAARALSAVNGVLKVSADAATVTIDFDDDVTSIQELRTTLQRAGVRVKKSAHGEEGMCCGSCGG